MRLSRMFVTAHYSLYSGEIPDGLSILGAVISACVGRPLTVVASEWLRNGSAATFRKELFIPLSRVVVDFIKTCGEPGILIDVTPKMEPKDKDNPKSEQVQGTDAEGNLKWTCTVSVSVPGLTKKVHEHLAITLISKTKPCTTIPEGSRVIVDDLTMGTMKAEKTGYTQFFSASAVRPVSVQAPQSAPR